MIGSVQMLKRQRLDSRRLLKRLWHAVILAAEQKRISVGRKHAERAITSLQRIWHS